jgi:hypothetical protein
VAPGFVSILTDVSSEMIHALLPVYPVTVLGTLMSTVGTIERIADATALFRIGSANANARNDRLRLAAFTKQFSRLPQCD